MDDYLDPLLSSSSSSPWEDAHLSQRLCWVETAVSQANGLLSGPVGICRGDDNNLHVSVINPNNIIGSMVTHPSAVQLHDATASIFADGNLMHGFNKLPGEDEYEQDIQRCLSVSSQHESEGSERSYPLQEVIESNPLAGSFDTELNNSCTMTMPRSAESGSIQSNDSDISVFPQSVGDSHSMSAVQKLWASSYSGVHSPFPENGKLENFGLQGKSIRTDANILGSTSIDYDELRQIESLPTALMEHNKLRNLHVPSFVSGKQLKSTDSIHFQTHQQGTFATSAGLQGPQQLLQSGEMCAMNHFTNHSPTTQPQPAPADAGGSNGILKARVRARRGQATDPHSIAERLRREKIAERMKNLQELVPNSNKTDKASMLDEIIDYVKFLQLQVKVLSMSRLGAAGAVVPLITNIPVEESDISLLGNEGYLHESQDSLALEKEVVKLMESNVTMAMQYLQNKGLCLMPVALAAAISGQKGSSGAIPPDRRKSDTNQSFIYHCTEPAVQEHAVTLSPNCNVVSTKEEEAKKTASTTRDMKPKA